MKNLYRKTFLLVFTFCCGALYAQTTISGKVKDRESNVELAGVNVIVKGRVVGTITNADGSFNLKVNDAPPLTLSFSFVGYRTQEVQITNASATGLEIVLEEQTLLGQEVVISASRFEESILESPVAIEKMDVIAVQTTPADNYYKAIANLKGVDVATSSINFQIINTRGFGSTGNTRFVQLTDGMDTQAPALNFPIGNLNGPSELDVESLELIPGASSALYGPNAFNGILLVNSKNAFEYQGLSAFAKMGVNHVGSEADFDGPSPVWEGALRYAKAFNNKFAFKINLAAMLAEDWHGTSAIDREIARTPGFGTNQQWGFNPGADRLHYMGDEASINLSIFRFSSNWNTFASTSNSIYNNIFEPGVTAKTYADAGDLPNQVVSVTPYREVDLIDYNAKNFKGNVGLYYRLNDKIELSYLWNAGFGTSIYTGAQRYSLQNFRIQQHRLQLRGDNFYVRAYGTFENSGDSYITEFLAKRIIDESVKTANPLFNDVSGYLATYGTEYLRYLYDQGYQPGIMNSSDPDFIADEATRNQIQQAAHTFARQQTDSKFIYDLNSETGRSRFNTARKKAEIGVVPTGPRFDDKTNMYHGEFQYDFKNQIDFMELQAGGSFRLYDLNSNGTIFSDGEDNITIKEYGAYMQAGKWLGDRKFKISGSVRYDKNENFEGRVNPRIALVQKINENNTLRLSYQTGFRIPTTQGQFIDLNIISARLGGGLPGYADKYDIVRTSTVTNEPLAYTGESVLAYRNEVFRTGNPNAPTAIALLQPYTKFEPVKPENVQNVEFGYKGVLGSNFLVDFTYYYNLYTDFITQIRIVTANEFTNNVSFSDGGAGVNDRPGDQFTYSTLAPAGAPNYATLLNGSAHNITAFGIDGNTSQVYSNFDGRISSQGAVLGLQYNLIKGYIIGGNYNWNVLNDEPSEFFSEFNTPEHKFNVSFGNRKVTDKIGFNVNYRWQDTFEWQSSFTIPANGMVPAYSTVDLQFSYKLSGLKSMLKVGGSNILNQKYIQSLGGPNIGALYYISLTFDELLR
jgi:outer membrane receptor protein involved in Fe transport